jgi:serine protease Do
MGYYHAGLPALTTSARAADAAQLRVGFADIVAKVTPAVISVRIKMDASVISGPYIGY